MVVKTITVKYIKNLTTFQCCFNSLKYIFKYHMDGQCNNDEEENW